MTTTQPSPTSGATAYGSHYLSTWDRCHKLGFLSFLAPHPKGGRGLRPAIPSRALKLGGILHVGLEHYYRSGPRDPSARDIDLAIHKMEAAAAERANEWAIPAEREEDVAKGRSLLYDYHQFWKGDPQVMVLEDEDGPFIEREWQVEIPGCPLPFTCRPDAVVEWNGWVYVIEHKSTSAWGMSKIRTAMLLNTQGTGECYVLHRVLPHLKVQGVLVNVLLKDRSSRSKYQPFERDTAARTHWQLLEFEAHVRKRHQLLHDMQTQWESLVADGLDPWGAAMQVYVATGASTGACENTYGRPCPMLDICRNVGNEAIHTIGFVAHAEANPNQLVDDLE